MKKVLFTLIALISVSLTINAQKQKTSKTHIKFFSTTPVEDIEANNYATVGTIEPATGKIVFSVPMQSFEFEKSLMQQHFNETYLESEKFPYATFKGKINELINFSKSGTYNLSASGTLNIHGVDQERTIKGKLIIDENN